MVRASLGGNLVRAQGKLCPYCGKGFRPNLHETEDRWRPSIDHVLPLSRGGYDTWGNVLAVHRHCNGLKADKLPTGCQLIWLVAVCERINVPVRLKPSMSWRPPPLLVAA